MRAYLDKNGCVYIHVDGVTIPFASPLLFCSSANFKKGRYLAVSGSPAKAFPNASPFRKVKLSKVFMG